MPRRALSKRGPCPKATGLPWSRHEFDIKLQRPRMKGVCVCIYAGNIHARCTCTPEHVGRHVWVDACTCTPDVLYACLHTCVHAYCLYLLLAYPSVQDAPAASEQRFDAVAKTTPQSSVGAQACRNRRQNRRPLALKRA